ncbi:MAG: CRISPR-associated endonuclease Cas1 [Erysipelotrichia bacterium]|nr:CRISPR-associated endonuclease Cas1 [Erysipelotrichia bacterium]
MEIGTLYIGAQGSKITRVGERLLVRDRENKILEDVPFFRLRQIVCFGSVEITSAATAQLMKLGVDVVYMTLTGRFKYRLSNMNPSAVKCRQSQYEKASCNAFRLTLARAMLRGKLLNSKNWLIKRNRPANKLISESIWKISTSLEMLESASTTDELLGIEGIAAKEYFEGFRFLLKQDLGFGERNRRPPKDPVNAMLSFGYTLLFNMIMAAVEQSGLDPMFSNLHAIQDRRPSLALDLMEEFRCLTVDTVVMRIVNLVRVQPRDFFYDERAGTRMREETIALLVSELQARLKSRVVDPVNQNQFQIKDLFLRQAYQYKAVVCGDREIYQPVVSR